MFLLFQRTAGDTNDLERSIESLELFDCRDNLLNLKCLAVLVSWNPRTCAARHSDFLLRERRETAPRDCENRDD